MRYGNYDNWKLATPWDDEPEMPEVYETEKYGYFHTDENLINEFDSKLKAYIDNGARKDDDTIDEYAEELSEEMELFLSEDDCLQYLSEKEYDEYLDAVENGYKGSYKGLSYRHHYAKSWNKRRKGK
jgi:hypothetical protein